MVEKESLIEYQTALEQKNNLIENLNLQMEKIQKDCYKLKTENNLLESIKEDSLIKELNLSKEINQIKKIYSQ